MKCINLLFCLLFSIGTFSQKQFVGKMVYSIQIMDTSLSAYFPNSNMTIYTNDTLIRVETQTDALGKQVLIHHLTKDKGYLLIESQLGSYAIQIPQKEVADQQGYHYKKTRGKEIVCGLKSKKLNVSYADFPENLDFFYTKSISAKYLPGFEDFPGLLTDYFVLTNDGIYHHQLVEIKEEPVLRDLFGIPSDYTKISMDEFVNMITNAASEDTQDNK